MERKSKKSVKKKNKKCCCEDCTNFVPIGEGDHICIAGKEPVLILEDYIPTDNYLYCNGSDYESWDDLDDDNDSKGK